jgi:hypothetical protein
MYQYKCVSQTARLAGSSNSDAAGQMLARVRTQRGERRTA